MRNSNYTVKFGWMRNCLGLRGSKLEVFAVIYGFSQDGESCFSGTYDYIADVCDISLRGAKYAVKELIELGYIAKIETQDRKNTYKICMDKIEDLCCHEGAKTAPSTEKGCKNCTDNGAKTAPSYKYIYNNNIYNTNSTNSSEDKTSEQAVILLPLNTKQEYAVKKSDIAEYEQLYPAVDVMQQLRAMRAWLLSNPKRRKTKAGITRFINSWLAREQDRGDSRPAYVPSQTENDDYEKWDKEWNIT